MKVAIVQTSPHSIIAARTRLLIDSAPPGTSIEVIDLFVEGESKQSLPGSFVGFQRLLKGRFDVVYFIGITWVVPQLLRLLTLGKSVVIYDAGNVEAGIAQTLGKSLPVIWFVSLLERFFVTGSDIVVVRGVSFSDYFRHKFKNLNMLIAYVPDPIDTETIEPAREFREGQALGIAFASTYFSIEVGGSSVPRGWELVDAVAILRRKFLVDVRVDFLGSGEGLDSLKARASDAGVADLCTFSGYVSRETFMDHLASADMGFMEDYDTLGYRYSIGHKVQEYMSMGLPVLTGNSPEKLHLLESQKLPSLSIDPPVLESRRQVEEYTERLAQILHYASLNRDILFLAGMRNMERAKQLFSRSVVAGLMAGVYRAAKERLSTKRVDLPQKKVDSLG